MNYTIEDSAQLFLHRELQPAQGLGADCIVHVRNGDAFLIPAAINRVHPILARHRRPTKRNFVVLNVGPQHELKLFLDDIVKIDSYSGRLWTRGLVVLQGGVA